MILFPPWFVEEEFIPKRDNKRLGYVAGEPFIKQKEIEVQPELTSHIEFCLRQKYNWKPKVFTDSGNAKIDEQPVVTAIPRGTAFGTFIHAPKTLGDAWQKARMHGCS